MNSKSQIFLFSISIISTFLLLNSYLEWNIISAFTNSQENSKKLHTKTELNYNYKKYNYCQAQYPSLKNYLFPVLLKCKV